MVVVGGVLGVGVGVVVEVGVVVAAAIAVAVAAAAVASVVCSCAAAVNATVPLVACRSSMPPSLSLAPPPPSSPSSLSPPPPPPPKRVQRSTPSALQHSPPSPSLPWRASAPQRAVRAQWSLMRAPSLLCVTAVCMSLPWLVCPRACALVRIGARGPVMSTHTARAPEGGDGA